MLDVYATEIDAAIRGCVAVTAYSVNTAQLSPSTPNSSFATITPLITQMWPRFLITNIYRVT